MTFLSDTFLHFPNFSNIHVMLFKQKKKFELKKKEEVTGRDSKVNGSVGIREGVWGRRTEGEKGNDRCPVLPGGGGRERDQGPRGRH